MTRRSCEYHAGYEAATAYQSELRSIAAQERLARQLRASGQAPVQSPRSRVLPQWAALWHVVRGRRSRAAGV
jgi:hypothetical protein